MPVKSVTGSVTSEEATRLRDYFAEQKQAEADRAGSHPSVIVRRRRKDAPQQQDEAAAVQTHAEKPEAPAEQKAPAIEAVAPAPAPAATEPVAAPEAPAAPAPQEPAPVAEPKARIVKPAKAASAARVISRPSDKQEPEPVVAAPEAPAAPAAQEAAPEAPKAVAETEVRESAPTEAAPAEKAPAEKPVEEKADMQEKAAKAARIARPDASAVPEGSSAPTLPHRAAETAEGAEGSAAQHRAPRAEAPSAPQVRIISRPAPGATPRQDARPARTGDARPGGYPPRDGAGRPPRPGGPRPGGPRPSGPGAPRPAGPRPGAPGGFGQQNAPATPTDSRDGQSKKKRLKGRRTVDFQQGDFGRRDDDDSGRLNRGKGRRKPGRAAAPQATQPLKAAKRKIRITEAIRVADMPGVVHTTLEHPPFVPRCAVLLDCGEPARLGQELAARLPELTSLNIDHHLGGDGMGSAANWVDPDAAATAQLMAYVALAAGLPLRGDLATAIALGVITDTGGFSHGNTSADIFYLSAHMVEQGCDIAQLREQLENTWSRGRLKLWGQLMQSAQLERNSTVGFCAVRLEDLRKCGALKEDLEGFVEQLRRIRGVHVAALLREDSPASCKFSLRSYGSVDVRAAAARLGGGGHRNAAGGTLHVGIDAASGMLLRAINEELAAEGL